MSPMPAIGQRRRVEVEAELARVHAGALQAPRAVMPSALWS
jgi:hypothetical protein